MAWTDLTKLSWLQFRPPAEYMLDAKNAATAEAAVKQRGVAEADAADIRRTENADLNAYRMGMLEHYQNQLDWQKQKVFKLRSYLERFSNEVGPPGINNGFDFGE